MPEAASILFGGGFPRLASREGQEAAQRAIYHVQLELEALAEGELVLCDRGTLDGLAYWPGASEEFLRQLGTTRQRELGRYDVVIHLRVPSPKNGFNHQNRLRIESADQARAIDRRIVAAWRGHRRRYFVDSSSDFAEKVRRALAILERELARSPHEQALTPPGAPLASPVCTTSPTSG